MSPRFNTMLATAMRLAGGDAASKTAAWRQIVDIVAQAGSSLDAEMRVPAFHQLMALRDQVSAADRRMAAASLAGRTRDPFITALFARDMPGVAAPFLSRAELDDDDWAQVIPTMPAAARNILRNRRDLPDAARTMLARFATADLSLPSSSATTVVIETPSPGVTQIRELVDRIAAYQQRKPLPGASPVFAASNDQPEARADGFVFETLTNGIIDWVEGASREAIIGMAIGETAAFGMAGVDGQAAGAWRRRAPFTDARLVVTGRSNAGGDWLISAAPLFNPHDGRFCGYRGSARRPRADERASASTFVDGIAPDSLRQLVHELRTPLNAIQGFAEMIDKQVLGPAAFRYRDRARAIMAEVDRLAVMVDDLDTSAKLDTGRLTPEPPEDADMATIVAKAVGDHAKILAARHVGLAFEQEHGSFAVMAAAGIAERMVARLLTAASAVAAPGERIAAAVCSQTGNAVFRVSRARALAGRDERALLDPEYGPDGDWPDAPLLGLGFTLRLVARLATQAGGRLSINTDYFALALPLARSAEAAMVGPAGLEPAT